MTLDQAVTHYVYHRRKMEQCSLQAISDKFGLGNTDNVRRICQQKKRHEDAGLIMQLNQDYHMHLAEAGRKVDIATEHGVSISKLDKLIQREREKYETD